MNSFRNLLIAALLSQTLLPSLALAIRNGTVVPEGKWTGVGAVNPKTFGAFCTGTLVAEDVVLTAAHCVRSQNSFVLAGAEAFAVRAEVHSEAMNQEFALLKLNRKFKGVEVYPVFPKPLPEWAAVRAVGFGIDLEGAYGIKREGDLVFEKYFDFGGENRQVSIEKGINPDIPMPGFSSRNDKKQVPCQGDSGGPLFVETTDGQWMIAGVNSFLFYEKAEDGVSLESKCARGIGVFAVSPHHNWEWLSTNLEKLKNLEIGLPFQIRAQTEDLQIFSHTKSGVTFSSVAFSSGARATSWDQANAFCQRLSTASSGGGTWRLPKRSELALVAESSPALIGLGLPSNLDVLWSGERVLTNAWTVNIKSNFVSTEKQYSPLRFLCVK